MGNAHLTTLTSFVCQFPQYLKVKIPDDAIIPEEKLSRYLLIPKARNDKSKFLAQAGFTERNPEKLRAALQSLIKSNEALEDRTDEYGTFYQVNGTLIGTNNMVLPVTTIWIQRRIDNRFQFVTLKPSKESKYGS